jgi:glycyl-tRNA synthetase
LQGVMGREYARRDGEDPAVAEAIGEQYQPIPRTKPGLALALADRLDSLAGLFAAGLAPSGTKDPFGLRRAAIGVVQPLMEHAIDFDVSKALERAARLQPVEVTDEVLTQVLDFITGRLAVLLKDAGYRYDVVDAVLAEQAQRPSAALKAVGQLSAWVARPDWNTILPAYARCVRIIRSAKDTDRGPWTVDDSLLTEPAERELSAAIQSSVVHRPSSVDELLTTISILIPSINIFFDKVLVMAEDPAVRQNRLGLVQQIAYLADGLADLSRLEGF